MSANLTLRFKLAEKAYRSAQTPSEELRCLETMLVELPKHKGTDRMQADLKSKISRLKKELTEQQNRKTKLGSPSKIPRQGAGRAVIIGGPNSGKSQLLASLTNASPEIGDYPFTTRTPQPAMMPWQDVKVQLIDTPPITNEVFDADVQALVRGCDLIVLMLDLGSDDGGEQLGAVLRHFENGKTRLGPETKLDLENIGVSYTRTLLVPNKMDLAQADDRLEFFDEVMPTEFETFKISALEQTGLEPLRDAIFNSLDCVRVYTKLPHKKEPDMEKPLTLPRGGTLQDLAELIHKDIAGNLKSAKVWGSQVHDGTVVKPDYTLFDGDIVELRT